MPPPVRPASPVDIDYSSEDSDPHPSPPGSARSSSPHPYPTYHHERVRVAPASAVDTVWYGWVLLISTWLVFVFGVGSVTGVWAWAWGEEERNWPQSIQEEDGVPIPGYYPAMVILLGVLAWVWVITAWVGLKYFKHARVRDQ